MHRLLTFSFSFLLSFIAHSQKTIKYYTYHWQPCEPEDARFYTVTEKTDSGWHRRDMYLREQKVQMEGSYEDDSCKIKTGIFHYFHSNGQLKGMGRYVHNKREGLWLYYYENGTKQDSSVYAHGEQTGISLSWFDNGVVEDSSVTLATGEYESYGWWKNGKPSSIEYYNQRDRETKTWKFYHENGQLSSQEEYADGKLMTKHYFDEDGKPMDTTNRDRDAAYPKGEKAWLNYLWSHLDFPAGYKVSNGNKAFTIVSFEINPRGEIVNAKVTAPLHPAFDKIALKAISNCKTKWLPAISHNRAVPAFKNQVVYFSMDYYTFD